MLKEIKHDLKSIVAILKKVKMYIHEQLGLPI